MKRILMVLVATLGFTVALQAPAHAGYSVCPIGQVCLWDGDGGVGNPMVSIQWSPGACYNLPSSINDRTNSFFNGYPTTSGRHIQLYKDGNCTGHLLHDVNLNDGPFGPGHRNTLYNYDHWSPPQDHIDVNKLSSIWFNSV